MCGIAGYLGTKKAKPYVLSALRRMEYRGYDSAGVALISKENKIEIAKEAGKVSQLASKIDTLSEDKGIGIGHTRWATHGKPNQINAHPHQSGDITIVHNGIIENYSEIKQQLQEKGVKFISDTDTEVGAALIDQYFKDSSSLHDATEKALSEIRGTFGMIVMSSKEPDTLIVARRGSPVVIGRKNGDIYIASDPTALIGKAKDILYLEDDEIAVCTPSNVDVYDFERKPQKKSAEELNLELSSIQKDGYEHFLIKEIKEQHDSAKETLRGHLKFDDATAHLGGVELDDHQIRQIQRLLVIGCGTSYNSGLLGKYLIEKMADIPVDVEVASEFRYREPVLVGSTVGVVLSQSGETADTLASLQELKQKGVYTHGLVNVIGSTIAREVSGGMYLHVGPEISVASTKAFTSQVVGLLLLGLYIARKRTLPYAVGEEIVNALDKLPKEIENNYKIEQDIKRLAKKIAKFDHAMILGRDSLYPIALEGALKMTEVAYIQTHGLAAGEMKHGPLALIDDSFLVIYLLQKGSMFEKSRTNLEEVSARGGNIFVITDSEDYAKEHKDAIFVETTSEWTAPVLFNLPLQLLAYYVAVERGTDVDQPRNLAKSVTVE